jgi:hypothetical protein
MGLCESIFVLFHLSEQQAIFYGLLNIQLLVRTDASAYVMKSAWSSCEAILTTVNPMSLLSRCST